MKRQKKINSNSWIVFFLKTYQNDNQESKRDSTFLSVMLDTPKANIDLWIEYIISLKYIITILYIILYILYIVLCGLLE